MPMRRRLRWNPQVRLHNPELERRLIRSRILVAAIVASVLLLGMGVRLYELQVHSHAHFATLSQGNRVRLRPLPPPRGLIYDRQGILLAENLPSFRLEIVPEDVPDLPQTLERLSRLVEITPRDRERFERERRRSRPFDAIPLRHRLTDRQTDQADQCDPAESHQHRPPPNCRPSTQARKKSGEGKRHVQDNIAGRRGYSSLPAAFKTL